MRNVRARVLTAQDHDKLLHAKFRPGDPQHKKEVLNLLQSWTGKLNPERLHEAADEIDQIARRYLYFRAKAARTPAGAELRRMLERRLEQFRAFRRSLQQLNYFELHWINGSKECITRALLLDLEFAECDLARRLECGKNEGYWTRRSRFDAKKNLLHECRDLMSKHGQKRVPGLTKGEGCLTKFARALYRYATGETRDLCFDRQIAELGKFDRRIASISGPS